MRSLATTDGARSGPRAVRTVDAQRAGEIVPLRRTPRAHRVAHRVAHLLELRTRILGDEPRLTRYTVGGLACDQTLDLTAAGRDLGYEPRVGVHDGLDAYAASLARNAP